MLLYVEFLFERQHTFSKSVQHQTPDVLYIGLTSSKILRDSEKFVLICLWRACVSFESIYIHTSPHTPTLTSSLPYRHLSHKKGRSQQASFIGGLPLFQVHTAVKPLSTAICANSSPLPVSVCSSVGQTILVHLYIGVVWRVRCMSCVIGNTVDDSCD